MSADFESIYQNTKNDIYRYICIHCRCIGDIDDIFQDTYIAVYEYTLRHGSDEIKSPNALVLSIAKRVMIKYYLLARRHRSLAASEPDLNYKTTDDNDRELLLKINKRLLSKSAFVQKIFFMRHSLDMSFAQIAQALSKREGAVKAQYYKAIADIRRYLEKEEK